MNTPPRIRVSYGRVKNLGNYETERVDMSLERDLEPGEEDAKALREDFDFLKTMVNDQLGI